jgi:hypothetical protein
MLKIVRLRVRGGTRCRDEDEKVVEQENCLRWRGRRGFEVREKSKGE